MTEKDSLAIQASTRKRPRAFRLVMPIVALLLGLAPRVALAEDAVPSEGRTNVAVLSPWPIYADDPVGSVPDAAEFAGKPLEYGYLLQDLSAEGDRAFHEGRYEEAVPYYQAMAKAAPTRGAPIVRMCESYERLGQLEAAFRLCKAALGREGLRPDDYVRFLELLLKAHPELSEEDVEDVRAIYAHVAESGVDHLPLVQLKCEVGLRLKDEAWVQECTNRLAKDAPDDPQVLRYQWALAVMDRDSKKAEEIIARAKESPSPPDNLDAMEAGTQELAAAVAAKGAERNREYAAIALAVAGLGGAAYAASRIARNRRRPAES